MDSVEIYLANKNRFVEKLNNKKYPSNASLYFDFGNLFGMLAILLSSDRIDYKYYNKEIFFLDRLVFRYYNREVL